MTPLRECMIEDMRVRNLARNTQISYLQQVSRFARYFGKSPDVLGREEVRAYQVYLTERKKLSCVHHHCCRGCAFPVQSLTPPRVEMGGNHPRPKKPQKLPVILSPEEVLEFLGCVRGSNHRTILTCCYAAVWADSVTTN